MIRDKKAILRVALALAFIFLFTGGVHELRKTSASPDFPCTDGVAISKEISDKDVAIEIAAGATGSDIAAQLFERGVVKSARAFFGVAVGDPRAAKIAPGSHIVSPQLCAKYALEQLLDNKRIAGLINIVEGEWNSEVFQDMVKVGYSQDDIKEAIAQLKLPAGFKSLEGLLFPAQYSFAKGTSAATAIATMVKRAQNELKSAGILESTGKFSAQEMLTIASIIQAEGGLQDFTKVSRVIRNRLEKGMPLQMDSTVHFAQKLRGNIFLSTKSTLLNSPYNTYRKYGLPPGPIGNPGRQALLAAVNPEPGDWIYFITVAPNDTRFTSSFEEFDRWKVEYKKNLRAGLFESRE
ncbi:MAG: hypothetical protein RL359_671 [Actinomycetota bacterium]